MNPVPSVIPPAVVYVSLATSVPINIALASIVQPPIVPVGADKFPLKVAVPSAAILNWFAPINPAPRVIPPAAV